ncbi:acyl-CoA synthetase (NDP forming) [Amycolatopsis bartoniae]|uniref:Pimeloyl-CoA synthetase n=1 Tax=Amycolatopsis bartoniae TaxID=941986 RepID=A0A8H9M8V5_9PSEU|nr:acetate--CoA ligase family protein [Amycolatopsis bartoniae]MBB2940156.1 acyl-CoA synthetase (NDP forming) [Amycolatopsis bartoniae]TVT06259.1 acetate--CoA ligase family protein [Amycolatopsis bartoniae]GHF36914.1 pimeloyl-CoA synthetase [Amycolatopsis bartoniae]
MTTTMDQAPADSGGRPGGRHRLSPLFEPRSVALVGASDRNAWSGLVEHALRAYGFDGEVYYVNPRGGTAHGHELATSLSSLPRVPDLVYVMVPAARVYGVLEEAAVLGVPAAEVLSSGFAEVGPEGLVLQNAIAELASRTGMAVLGPNNLGFANVRAGIGLTPMGQDAPLRPGSVAIVSQSGNLGGQLSTLARQFDVGVSVVVSTGNEVGVTAGDVIDYLVDDPGTTAIGVFLETIRRPDDFRAACLRAHAAGKLVVVLKAGRSEAAARSAMAHTGSLVGDDAVIEAALTAAGVVRVDTLEDLLATADIFTRVGPIRGNRVGVTSISGGAGDIAGDLAEPLGLQLPQIAPETAAGLAEVLPSYGTAQNPLDVTGAAVADRELFGKGLALMSADPNIDVSIAITEADHMAATPEDGMLAGLLSAAENSPVPALLVSTTVRTYSDTTLRLRREHPMPAVAWGLDRVLTALSLLARHARAHLLDTTADAGPLDVTGLGPATGTWSESRSRALLEREGVPVVPATVVRDGATAAGLVAGSADRYALKIVSPDIAHKSDVGGVVLGVAAADVPAHVDALLTHIAAAVPGASVDGVLVSPMREGGLEFLVGVVRDPDWGAVLAVGMGGVWTETLRDVRRIALPADRDTVRDAILELKAAPLLQGARGSAPIDVDRLADVVWRIGDLARRLGPDLAALEVNPLRVAADGIEALDALVVWND